MSENGAFYMRRQLSRITSRNWMMMVVKRYVYCCQPGTRSHRIHIENISSYTRMTAKGFSLGVLPAWSPISRFFKGTMPASHRITTKRMVPINTGHSGLLASKSKAPPSIPHPLNRRELVES